jgi:hypothetical protein
VVDVGVGKGREGVGMGAGGVVGVGQGWQEAQEAQEVRGMLKSLCTSLATRSSL